MEIALYHITYTFIQDSKNSLHPLYTYKLLLFYVNKSWEFISLKIFIWVSYIERYEKKITFSL